MSLRHVAMVGSPWARRVHPGRSGAGDVFRMRAGNRAWWWEFAVVRTTPIRQNGGTGTGGSSLLPAMHPSLSERLRSLRRESRREWVGSSSTAQCRCQAGGTSKGAGPVVLCSALLALLAISTAVAAAPESGRARIPRQSPSRCQSGCGKSRRLVNLARTSQATTRRAIRLNKARRRQAGRRSAKSDAAKRRSKARPRRSSYRRSISMSIGSKVPTRCRRSRWRRRSVSVSRAEPDLR